MRIVAFVLGLIFSLIVLGASFFSFFASSLGSIANLSASDVESLADAGGYGFLLSILGFIGASLAFKYRAAPAILLLLTAAGLIVVGTYTIHGNMAAFGVIMILPAIFAAASKKKAK